MKESELLKKGNELCDDILTEFGPKVSPGLRRRCYSEYDGNGHGQPQIHNVSTLGERNYNRYKNLLREAASLFSEANVVHREAKVMAEKV